MKFTLDANKFVESPKKIQELMLELGFTKEQSLLSILFFDRSQGTVDYMLDKVREMKKENNK